MRLKYPLHVTLLVSLCAAAQTGPLSLDRFSQRQRLYMLDESGRIVVSERPQIDAPKRVLTRVPSSLKALDILSTKLWEDREMVFVTAYGLTADDARSRLIQYSATGEQQCEWILPEVSAGLDVDPDKHIVYLSGSSTGTVYALKLLSNTCYGSNQLKPVIQVKEARRLGPVVVDQERQLAFVADVLKGSVYKLDLARGGSLEVVKSLGQPVALLYDNDENLMYVADAAGRRIWRVNVDRFPGRPPVVFSRDPALQEPSSLAFASDGKLLIGDRRAKVIFALNRSGQVVSQFSVP
jgi:DNA-binding beta-propeller fold protein YncE